MSMVFCSSLMLEKSSNHSSSTRDLKISLAFVMNKTPYSHFLLTVFTHCKNWDNSPQDLLTMTLAKAKVWGNAAKCFSSVFSWDYFFSQAVVLLFFFLFLIWRKVSQLAILIWLGNIFMSILLGEAHPQYVENNLNKKPGLGAVGTKYVLSIL